MSAQPSIRRILVNLVAFQLGWLACVLGGAHQLPWLGVGVVVLVAALHLATSPERGSEARLLVLIALMGALWDGLLARFGFLVYPSGMLLPWLAPVWIIAIWVAFATTLNVSLAWLQGRWYLAFTIGALGAPLAYYAGAKLGGVHFPDPVVALAVLGGGWSFLMPASLALAARLARTATAHDTTERLVTEEGTDA
ncbi:DUF2878 domain-containing protein [Marichromatium bheemlicum]|uniref:DUF2878 domain-containing protein n=1 Tax=Marichromatium bheemlicum TaxID=365339 RepID=A0ABX1I6F4_9GAMM|nr:DUF2878 domain-containing protein [Marichromatium bheemlicum]NKN32321.1 DUF2878 domain-containing protein [Marichromatium bheemlicum]